MDKLKKTEKKWMLYTKKADFLQIGEKFHIDQVTARLIRNRDYIDEKDIDLYLNGSMKDLYSPHLLKDMDKACEIILNNIREGKSFRIIGDYDIDGVCSTYILYAGLKRLGADVDYAIPERIKDGYGLNQALVDDAKRDGRDTIITCDNGIAAYSQIQQAKKLGITVIITDHHDVPFDEETGKQIIPNADAVINPKQTLCTYPCNEICGATIAFKLISCLFEVEGLPKSEGEEFIQFAAFATVGDVCLLRGENRIIVKEGLKKIGETSNVGMIALSRACNVNLATLNTYQIGFVLGPCINATGRLRTADKALSLFLCMDEAEAEKIAQTLVELNKERRSMTENHTKKALEIIRNQNMDGDKVLVIYLEDCHESIAGIIAGRIKERFYKPTFVLTDSCDGAKGSGRSIEAYDMYKELNKVKELFTKFGGHKMAAGLSLPKERISEFRKRINDCCCLTDEDFLPVSHIDIAMPPSYISFKLLEEFEKLKPFGPGNPKPLFAVKDAKILYPKLIGSNKNVVKTELATSDGFTIEAMVFDNAPLFYEYAKTHHTMSILYYPDINEYGGSRRLQLVITDFR